MAITEHTKLEILGKVIKLQEFNSEVIGKGFLWSMCVKPSEIYRRMKIQYRDSFLSQGRVYEWVERFQNGRENVSDEHRSGKPVSLATETVKQQIEQRIRDYRRVTIDKIVVELNTIHGSAYNIVHDHLRYMKVCSRWFPRQMTNDHKVARQTICQEHLDSHAYERDAFLHRIVTGDESWVFVAGLKRSRPWS